MVCYGRCRHYDLLRGDVMVGIIIQARLGSKRLPRKVLLPLAGKTVIEWIVDRCLETGFLTILAVPEGEGQEFKDVLKERCCPIFEGHPTDVLDRYYEAAKAFQFDPIVRITGDCPLVDSTMIKAMVKEFKSGYLSNCHPIRTVPKGLDIEIFDFEILERAWQAAVGSDYREHVTKYFYSFWHLDCATYSPPFPDSWTTCIDTQEDYDRVKAMIEEGKYPWLN